ncbi:D-3-phosphoglycerate dehydrogenase [Renibacterium salmoninarum ATCC 33209]|uniref:D-3-phosphoglycerate dehydrogenase n=1 Tax=Renibacterium salmoninarum (strain ATCC 33209 / DSM 20767 / JCM 11484 / NBRC 15589 / NCIMB 2235) TaxID=288705 RepID=A9WNY4_RENSM|nr:D-3-phosphoglycerate dehydrogenase [Renibacterium salmoninarum ATCC 33209]
MLEATKVLLVRNHILIRNVLLPSEELLTSIQPVPDGLNVAVWNLDEASAPFASEEVDAVVLPYVGALAPYQKRLADFPNLKLVQTQTTGFDGVANLGGPQVAICSAAGVHAASTAELAIGLILASLRGLDVAARDQPHALWRHERRTSLADRKVLLLGVGGIGREIEHRLRPFEVSITRVGRTRREDEHGTVHSFQELLELAPQHDVLIAVVPLTEETTGLVGEELLAKLPNGALVVNVGRGAVVDSDALTVEVLSGRLHAALDVFDPEPIPANHPLWRAPKAFITPHLGGDSSAFPRRIAEFLQKQLNSFALGELPANLVRTGFYQE